MEEAWVSESGVFKLLLLGLVKSAGIPKRFLQSPHAYRTAINAHSMGVSCMLERSRPPCDSANFSPLTPNILTSTTTRPECGQRAPA